MVTEKWTLHAAVVGSAQINQTKEFVIDPRVAKYFEYGSGSVDPAFFVVDGEEPLVRFASTAIKRALAAVEPNEGQPLGAGVNLDLYFQQMAPGGTRKTGATGMRWRVSAGSAILARIRAQDGQGAAQAEIEVYPTSVDGETGMIEVTNNVALPTLLATDQLYTMGPAVLAGLAVADTESFEFDPKIQFRRNRGGGEPYATFGYIARRGNEQDGPSIMLSTRKLSHAVGGTTRALVAGDYVSLRAFKSGSTREALTAAKHIKFTPNAGALILGQAQSRDGDEALLNLEVAAVRTTSLPAFSVSSDVALVETP